MKVARKRKATPTKRPQSDPQQRVLPKDNSRAGSTKIGGPRVSCGRSPTPINRDGREGSKSESQQPYKKGGPLTTTRWTHNSALTASSGARAWYSFYHTARAHIWTYFKQPESTKPLKKKDFILTCEMPTQSLPLFHLRKSRRSKKVWFGFFERRYFSKKPFSVK